MDQVYDSAGQLEWLKSPDPVLYPHAIKIMEDRVAAIHTGQAPEAAWLLEHPSLYTAGTSAEPSELVEPDRFPVFETGRGGRYTYHGPGQRVGYVMMDLTKRRNDIRAFVRDLEEWVIQTLAAFGVQGERREGRVGIWVAQDGGREDKIAAIGVRVRRWVSYHGVALNVAPNLDHFSGIIPCGISGGNSGFGVTSLKDLGIKVTMEEVDAVMVRTFQCVFGVKFDPGEPTTL
jgi:lipoyl(octanoyl) transferase